MPQLGGQMKKLAFVKSVLIGGVSVIALCSAALADEFNIPSGDLGAALDAFAAQTGVNIIIADDAVRGARTHGAKGEFTATAALTRILSGTGFVMHNQSGAIGIVRDNPASLTSHVEQITQTSPVRMAAAASAGIESVVVTSSKIKGDIQTVPIAITALSQEQLTSRQIAGGPDLVKEVPNLTFSKTNFTGYNIQIRGIGTQAISVTTDPAVAVAFNDIPFIRNHFFEQEFYDVNQVEVLRGPQGTLYGRNATAGVVNVISAKPTDQFEAMLSADIGNYHNRRYEGMINVPIVDDRADLRIAGEWTKRDGYSFNAITNAPIDGRDLWSGRVTLSLKPTENLQATIVWEHFGESDDRMRTAKQLCKTQSPPTSVNGVPVPAPTLDVRSSGVNTIYGNYLSQSCQATSLYSPDAFEVPYGFSLPYAIALGAADGANVNVDPYSSTTQSRNLRVIESAINPHYQAKNDVLELNADYALTPSLTFTSQSGYNQDFLWSTEDYNRFNTSPGVFLLKSNGPLSAPDGLGFCDLHGNTGTPSCVGDGAPCVVGSSSNCAASAIFCDPQLGCSDRIVAEDLSEERAWQLSQEFRLSSNFGGPLNFSVGGNYLHYETEENYYVFINALTAYAKLAGDHFGNQSTPDNSDCLQLSRFGLGYQAPNPISGGGTPTQSCVYIDTNPIGSLDNNGHNYFLSQNPYILNSYAGFGEAYYNVTSDLKLTGGLRWTEDRKRFIDIPSEVVTQGYGYYVTGVVDQQWDQLTGRAAVNWSPKLDFTDQTLVYGSYARGYKAGGANPPGAVFSEVGISDVPFPVHPLTFKPEFINAYELGSKNTLLDGALTLNGDVFYYDYKSYQISEIVDRTSINLNFNATVKGAELETSWEPAPGLKFSFAGGYEDTRINDGQSSIDLMDRTAGMPGWMVFKPFPTEASNCILPTYVVQALLEERNFLDNEGAFACGVAYTQHLDPVTLETYTTHPTEPAGIGYAGCSSPSCEFPVPSGYPGFDPTQPIINNGAGFAKNLGGNELPNAPHFTTSLSAEYTIPVSEDWAATLHSDFYWQSQSFARVFNDRPYDKIRGYSNVNLALILTSASGWQVLGYLKNVFNTTAITGDFLNSDDSGLTTNVFLTDPRLYGVRVTKNF
jgi:iron complex outermembrane recepter protein